ncbi:hypothetical protein AAG747_21695 [Rapidithrix thailandica]|uniref:Uncharacterized protein n=1 Tax=Rapidithrix thailandica TaxID=413964 RepID=A0AAW9SDY0_9BACT
MYRLFLFLICQILVSCNFNKNKEEHSFSGELYNVCINYHDESDRLPFKESVNQPSKDSLHLFIEKGFDNDLIAIYINGKKVHEEVLTTIDQSGFAKYFNLGSLNKINDVGIRVNKGKLAFMEIDKSNFLLNLNYPEKLLILSVLEHVPFYD